MASALLLFLWTVWLVVALCLLGSRRGGLLVGTFALLGVAVLFAGSHAWRPYLMAWLGGYAVVSCYHYLDSLLLERHRVSRSTGIDSTPRSEDPDSRGPRPILLSGVSLAGVLWLWIQGGALYWRYFAVVAAAIVGLTVATWLVRRLWRNHQGQVQRRINDARADAEEQAAAKLRERDAVLTRRIGLRDARLAECGDQLRAARLEYAAQSRDLSAAERRIRHLSGEREHRENQLAELQRDLRERHEREERMREAERKLISDIFCCTACQSIWLITADSDTRVTRRPAGEGCNVCAGPAGTMRRPSFLIDADDGLIAWERQSRTTAGPAGSVSGVPAPAPSLTLTGLGPQPDSQPRTRGRPEDRIRIGVKLGVDLAALDPQAVSDDVTGWASERVWDGIDTAIPADGCKVLSSVADALDSIPDEIAGCVVWCARAAGAPRVIAEILGGLTTLAIEAHVAPLHAMAQEIRVIGTVSCAAQGADRLERCECARGLARALSADLAANAVEHYLSPAIDELRDLGRPPAIEPPAPITPPAVNPPAAGGISALG